MRWTTPLGLLVLCVWGVVARAEHHDSPFYERSVRTDEATAYDAIYHSLEESRFWVIAEPNIGKTLARNEKRWGENYNRNGYEAIRSLVFCNPWYANELSNLAPTLLAMCPFNVTMLYRNGVATVVFERPSQVVTDGPAKALVAQLDAGIVGALDRAFDELEAEAAQRGSRADVADAEPRRDAARAAQ